jgi:hypothetical protein
VRSTIEYGRIQFYTGFGEDCYRFFKSVRPTQLICAADAKIDRKSL